MTNQDCNFNTCVKCGKFIDIGQYRCAECEKHGKCQECEKLQARNAKLVEALEIADKGFNDLYSGRKETAYVEWQAVSKALKGSDE